MTDDEKSGLLSADGSILRWKKILWAGGRRQFLPRLVVSEKREGKEEREIGSFQISLRETFKECRGEFRRSSHWRGEKHVRGRTHEGCRPLQGKQGTRKISLEVRKTGVGRRRTPRK
jgi:hypothetical protein